MKQLIHVSCTSAYKYPERPRYLLIRGKKYDVVEVMDSAKIQSVDPPFHTVHYYLVKLDNDKNVEIEYHEKSKEWYLLNFDKLNFI